CLLEVSRRGAGESAGRAAQGTARRRQGPGEDVRPRAGAEVEYAKGVGVRLKQPNAGSASEVKAFREAIRKGLSQPKGDGKWPIPYAVRRTAWHALDHAWEMEDRIT